MNSETNSSACNTESELTEIADFYGNKALLNFIDDASYSEGNVSEAKSKTSGKRRVCPEDHPNWCENELPEPLVRIADNAMDGVYEDAGGASDSLVCAMSGALSIPVSTLREALAEGVDNPKLHLAISQLLQIEIDVANILFVHEEGMTDEQRLRRKRHLEVRRAEIAIMSRPTERS